MHAIANHDALRTFPVITFRKKRLSVAVHASFDLADAEAVAGVKEMIETGLAKLTGYGNAKVTYSLIDI